MVVDSSAFLAILFAEPEREAFAAAIAQAGHCLVSSFNALEVSVVVSTRKGPAGGRELDLLFHHAQVEVVAFTEAHLRLAREAYERFGKGRHRAGLNLGDCCAYALSRHSGEALLFKGNDFPRTDVLRAL